SSAVQHLLDLGHRRIAVLAGPSDSVPARQRVQGYHSALGQAGVIWERELIEHGDFSYEDGQRGAEKLLQQAEPPTAIFAVADTLAVGALRAARRLGIDVPEQLSVISFDDTMIAQWTHPQRTAVRQPLFSMGQVAIERLLALSSDPGLFATPSSSRRISSSGHRARPQRAPTADPPRAPSGDGRADRRNIEVVSVGAVSGGAGEARGDRRGRGQDPFSKRSRASLSRST